MQYMEHSFPIKTTFNNNKTGYLNSLKMKKQIIRSSPSITFLIHQKALTNVSNRSQANPFQD